MWVKNLRPLCEGHWRGLSKRGSNDLSHRRCGKTRFLLSDCLSGKFIRGMPGGRFVGEGRPQNHGFDGNTRQRFRQIRAAWKRNTLRSVWGGYVLPCIRMDSMGIPMTPLYSPGALGYK